MPHSIFRRALRRLSCIASALTLAAASGHAPIGAAPPQTAASEGRSVTVLPDGRRLLIGGESARGLVAVQDAATGEARPLPVSPLVPRAWHTATLLADGSILIVGGVDAKGETISFPERFDLERQSFEPLPADGFTPRARHTATLLTDGRVLIAGGHTTAGGITAELWDPRREAATVLNASMLEDRFGHRATLLGDGRVLIEGGATPSDPASVSEVFDPVGGTFERQTGAPLEPEMVSVTAAAPADSATGVPVDVRLVFRFTSVLAPDSLTPGSVSLVGPQGSVDLVVVPAESGRLAFVSPRAPLEPGTSYRVVIDGAVAADSRRLQPFALHFTTAKEEPGKRPPPVESEDWVPDTRPGRTWATGRPASPWQKLPPLQARPGVTALAGQALMLTGQPLADVSLTIARQTAQTDKTGRFLLELPAATAGRRQLEIEGATASRPGRTYGYFEVGVTLAPGRTTVLPYTIWMPAIDTAHAVRIASPTRGVTVITTPKIPGLELHLPRGSIVKDRDGRIVSEISITPIPIDRPPFPLPTADVPVYFTIQPGGAYVYGTGYRPHKARLIYPNYQRLGQDVVARFFHYDPSELDWYVYGAGRVKGQRVVPDPGVGIYEFTGAMILTGWNPAPWGPPPWWGPSGDPVDVSTGLFVLQKVDLALSDTIPLTLQRTYRPADNAVRPFGIGATHDYAMFLWSANQYTEADLILPDSARVHYVRTSPGTGYTDAIFEHTTSPTRFYKSRIAWNGNGWDLTLQDGSVYVFGSEAPLQSIRDRFGNTVTLTWSDTNPWGLGIGNILKVTSPNGRWIAFTYDASNRITEARDNIARTVGYEYDASGRLWKVTDANGGVTEYTYDTSNRLLTIKDARGIVYLTNEYNTDNRVMRQTQADGSTFEFAYTVVNGKVTQGEVTNPRGHVTRTTFNPSGYPSEVVEAVGTSDVRTTTYTRAPATNVVMSVLDSLDRETSYTYDPDGNLASVTRLSGTPDAVTATFGHDGPFNLVTSVTDPLTHTTSIAYDSQGRLESVTDALTHQTTFDTTPAGQVRAITDPLARTTQFTYEEGDLTSTATPLGHVATQFTDAAGRVVRATDPNGAVTRFEYDPHNQVTKVIDALGAETSFTYDGNGNLLTLTDARGKTTTWTYDNMDRVATRTDPLLRQESFTYDANGNLETWTDRKGQVTTYQSDALDRQTFVGFGTTGTPPTYASTITNTYDAGDRLTQIVESAGGTIQRTYDLLDRLTQETTPEGTVTYTYDTADRRATMQVAGQSAVAYTYDNADRLTGITQGSASVVMAYDNVGRRTSLTLPNGIVVEYAYDDDSRLTGLTYTQGESTIGDLTYAYDAAGRRTSVGGTFARTGLPAALASATYDDANQIATFGGTTFTYDANGSLTSDGVRSYTWDARNQLASLTGPVNGSFAYDGVGRRRNKTVGGTTTQFLHDGLNPVQELSGGTPTANLLTGLGIDEYFTRTDAAGVRNYLTDVLGSSVALTDGTGAVQTAYTYDPFGGTTTSGASTGNAFGFTGRESDGTGVFFYRARFYDPRAQRFISEDPLGVGGGFNVFAYVSDDPVNLVDPLGLKPGPGFGPSGAGPGPGSGPGPGGAAPPPGPNDPAPPGMRPPKNSPTDPRWGDPSKWKRVDQPGRRTKWVPTERGPGSKPQIHWDPEDGYFSHDDGRGSPRDHFDVYGRRVPPGYRIPWWLPMLEGLTPPLIIIVNPCSSPVLCGRPWLPTGGPG